MAGSVGRVVRRTAWLLVGAAIGLAAALLLTGVAQVVAPARGPGRVLLIVLCLLPALLLGFLPGVRELEATAARALLGVTGDLVVPTQPRAGHRVRTAALVIFHLSAGLVAAALLIGVVPGAVALAVASLRGRAEVVAGAAVPPVRAPLAVLLGILGLVGCLVAVWVIGRLARAVAAQLLGPTTGDRLEVALRRLEAEAEHTRLARELHDGIGHALTIIGVQAAAGRRTPDREQTVAALGVIESTARQALEELDGLLGMLRHGEVARRSEPGLDRLAVLVEAYRSAGMDVVCAADLEHTLPRLVSTTAYRIVAEALTNASRHAGPGPVRLKVGQEAEQLAIEVSSPLRPGPAGRGRGRGLIGIGERLALFGGSVDAGPDHDSWVLRARLPTGTTRG